jgi:hypothetical protein
LKGESLHLTLFLEKEQQGDDSLPQLLLVIFAVRNRCCTSLPRDRLKGGSRRRVSCVHNPRKQQRVPLCQKAGAESPPKLVTKYIKSSMAPSKSAEASRRWLDARGDTNHIRSSQFAGDRLPEFKSDFTGRPSNDRFEDGGCPPSYAEAAASVRLTGLSMLVGCG